MKPRETLPYPVVFVATISHHTFGNGSHRGMVIWELEVSSLLCNGLCLHLLGPMDNKPICYCIQALSQLAIVEILQIAATIDILLSIQSLITHSFIASLSNTFDLGELFFIRRQVKKVTGKLHD